MKTNHKLILALTCAAGLLASSGEALAINWLKMQGTEPPGTSGRARVWGFIQPEYQQTDGTKLQAGPWKGQNAAFNMSRPDLKSDSGFNLIRARIGVRGTGFPLDSDVNYFFLAEFGNNGITHQGGGSVKLTDASVTLNEIKGARIRVGTFKTPGSEEALMAIHVFNYVNFSNGTNQLLLERYFNGDGSSAKTSLASINKPNGPVSAFRDTGIQVFDWFTIGNWEHTYALMVGNGNGITRNDNDGNREVYAYWASELLFTGATPFPSGSHLAPPSWSADHQGPRGVRYQSLKLYGWYQGGKRTLTTAGDGAGVYDRTRQGVGFTLLRGKVRAGAEYFVAKGMIFNGTDGGAVAGSHNNAKTAFADFNVTTNGEANSWYLDFGYLIHPKLELDIRYDTLNRDTNISKAERKFDTLTLGAQYFFNKKSRLIVNYEMRNASAPNLPGSAAPNKILDGMDNRVSAQLLIIF